MRNLPLIDEEICLLLNIFIPLAATRVFATSGGKFKQRRLFIR